METTGIKLFGKKIMCYNSPKNTNLRILTGEEFSDCSNDEVAGFDKMEHSDEDQVRERKQEDGNTRKTETEGDTTNSQLKKPDTILPCPRCKSMDTKFCYYNNYNVKQPRHFCKSCQRYWTAGGTMRTMPVGAGRRRNKNPPSHDQAFLDSQINVPNGVPRVHPKFLSFGLDLAHFDKENLDELSSSGSGSTVTTSNSESEKIQDRNRFNSHESSIPSGVSWIYNLWNSAVPIPSFYPAGFSPMPMPIYPSPYWNYIPSWLQNDTNSSILGKHSRERELVKSNGSEEPKKQKSSVLFPKARRFDDPDESAKSSIWLTLGIKNDDISTRGVFKALPTRGEENNKHTVSTSTTPVLQANPAALSRSFCFQETA